MYTGAYLESGQHLWWIFFDKTVVVLYPLTIFAKKLPCWFLNGFYIYPWFSRRTTWNSITKVLFCDIYVITSSSFVFENGNITLEKTWFPILQDLRPVITTTCITPLLNILIFKIKSNYIFNSQELHQKTWNCKSSLFKKYSQWE